MKSDASLEIGTLFDDADPRWEKCNLREDELFRRAYGDRFGQVIHRLDTGFSLLVYLPGNCMRAAASMVRRQLTSYAWSEYCHDISESQNIEELFTSAKGIASKLKEWLGGEGGQQPAAIFHNLDLLADGTGRGIYSSTGARTLVAALVQATRGGVVLGLAEREVGTLPEDLARLFPETLHLDEIPLERFHGLVPCRLGEQLAQADDLTAGSIRALAARLRWTDPIRAHAILAAAAQRSSRLPEILEAVLESTRPVHFIDLGPLAPEEAQPSGFPDRVITTLERDVVKPFEQWIAFTGDIEAFDRATQRLPAGVVLHGPPGTGKTRLAKWIARQIGLPTRIVSGSQIRSSGWGDAEKQVRALFREVRRAAPCALVLDDADDLLPAREKSQGGLAAAERAVVNEFLQQLQGIHGRLEGVLVILTTNRFSALDQAAKERLSVHVRVPYPVDEKQLLAIVRTIARDLGYELDPDVEKDLVSLFMKTRDRKIVSGERWEIDADLFSPREVETAMRFLRDASTHHDLGALYRPTPADVKRVDAYYDSGP